LIAHFPPTFAYILEISSKSVDNYCEIDRACRFHEKNVTTYFTQKLANTSENVGQHYIFETYLEKKSSQKTNFFIKKNRKNFFF